MRRRDIQEWYGTAMTKIKASIIILSLIMIGCKDKKKKMLIVILKLFMWIIGVIRQPC